MQQKAEGKEKKKNPDYKHSLPAKGVGGWNRSAHVRLNLQIYIL